MATVYTAEAGQALVSGRRAFSSSIEGKVRRLISTFVTAAAAGAQGTGPVASGDVQIVCRLPAGSRLLPSTLVTSATLGTATVQLGTYRLNKDGTFTVIAVARYFASAAPGAGPTSFANTLAVNAYDTQTEEVWLGALVATAGFANGVTGIYDVSYVSD